MLYRFYTKIVERVSLNYSETLFFIEISEKHVRPAYANYNSVNVFRTVMTKVTFGLKIGIIL